MRPGPIGPGNDCLGLRDDVQRRASMRPGPIGPGNGPRRRPDRLGRLVASMRPGPIGPGNMPTLRIQRISLRRFNAARPNWAGKSGNRARTRGPWRPLQCGPAQLGREIGANGLLLISTCRLQCGPAQLGREISRRPPSEPRPRSGFNAARPNWAGKSRIGGCPVTEEQLLQCGPAQLGREITYDSRECVSC